MNGFNVFAALSAFCVCGGVDGAPAGQQPVAILKQVNRQNEDGSYSYGYENADGTFKIETKYPTGEVYGKYGYVDETGGLRTVEYGASSSRGFQPVGEGIDVPPPAPAGGGSDDDGGDVGDGGRKTEDDYDDGQYREDPAMYYKKSERQPVAGQQQQWYGAGAGHKQQRARHPAVSDLDPSSGSFSVSYTS